MSGDGDEAERLQVLEQYRKKVSSTVFYGVKSVKCKFFSFVPRGGRSTFPVPSEAFQYRL